MKNDEGLDFALSRRTGRMVDITTVARGLACDCVCAHCGATLQAKKGRKNRHHFAHYAADRVMGVCEGGVESALHAAARQIIAGWRVIELPALLVEEAGRQASIPGRVVSIASSELPDDHGGASYWGRGRVRPDVVLHADSEQVWCEVAVTHEIDDLKRGRLELHDVSTLEFDLSGIYRRGGWTLVTLEQALKNDAGVRRWAYHPDEAAVRQRLRAESAALAKQYAMAAAERGLSPRQDTLGTQVSANVEDVQSSGDWGPLVFHPALGLIPEDPIKRLAFVAQFYPEPLRYELPGVTAFLRRHPHGHETCLVTFGRSRPTGLTSQYDAALSYFARTAGMGCVYFGIAETRQVRGPDCHAQLDRFLKSLTETEAAGSDDDLSRNC
jgi:hypothetical protein